MIDMSSLMDKLDLLKSLGDGATLSDVVRALEAIAEEINSIKLTLNNLKERVDAIDSDLSSLENTVYGEVEIECPSCNVTFIIPIEEVPESGILDVECPNCHSIFTINLENWGSEETDD